MKLMNQMKLKQKRTSTSKEMKWQKEKAKAFSELLGKGMCPHCFRPIKYLNYSCHVVEFGDFCDGEFNSVSTEGMENLEFHCPECDYLLFTDEDEATEFTKEKKP